MTVYYKWLLSNNSSPMMGDVRWVPGEWRGVEGALIPRANALHLCRPGDLIEQIDQRLWTAEADESEIIHDDNEVVVRRARILTPVETINDTTLRLFACDCADRVAHLAKDARSVAAIAVSRRYARALATQDELNGAYAVAGAVAGDAAWHDARDDAKDAAYAATWDAAYSAASAAALAAAYAAGVAAGSGAGKAAWAAERAAQNARLLQYVKYGEAAEAMTWEAGK